MSTNDLKAKYVNTLAPGILDSPAELPTDMPDSGLDCWVFDPSQFRLKPRLRMIQKPPRKRPE